MKYWIYVLKSERDGGIYIGHAENMKVALEEHELGAKRETKYRLPMKLIFKEQVGSFQQVKMRERYWASEKGLREIEALTGPVQRWKSKYEYREERKKGK